MKKKQFIRPCVSLKKLGGETILAGSDVVAPNSTTPNETPTQGTLDWGTGGLKG